MKQQLVLAAIVFIISILLANTVQAGLGDNFYYINPVKSPYQTSKATPEAQEPVKCITSLPAGMESCPCVYGQPPTMYDNCGQNGEMRCYCKKADALATETEDGAQDDEDEIGTEDSKTFLDYASAIEEGLRTMSSNFWKLITSSFSKKSDLEKWQDKLEKEAGSSSNVSKTLEECIETMEYYAIKCPENDGWSVDNQISINDFKADENYEFQETRGEGCEKTNETDFTPEVKYLDSQSEDERISFQVVCKIACNHWGCD